MSKKFNINGKIIKLNVKAHETYSKDRICFTHSKKKNFKASNYKLSIDLVFFSFKISIISK
jgi:hypothetical protein